MIDPVKLALLMAPFDDEPESEQEREAVEKALKDTRPNIPLERVLRDFGL